MSEPEAISYAAWGEQFFTTAVTEPRILAAVVSIAGRPIDVAPMGVGPGRLAKVSAKGTIGAATCEPLPGDLVAYRLWLQVSLAMVVDLQLDTHRFAAELRVPIELTAQALPGLQIFIDATPPRSRDIVCDLKASGLRASLLSQVAGVEAELCRFVAKYVARELASPEMVRARTIDVARSIDEAMPG